MDPMEARLALYNALSEADGGEIDANDEKIVLALEDLIDARISAALNTRTAEDE